LRAHSLELTNFCQHEHFETTLAPGLTAIIGPNGSGKSNLLGGILFALTGENPNAGNKEDNIRQTAASGACSSVAFSFSHAGTSARVVRHLRPAATKTVLEIAGAPTVSGDRQVNPLILEILGVDAELLKNIVIVQQSELFGFLAKTPARRAETFRKLFGVARAAEVYDFLGERLREIPDIVCPTPEEYQEIRTDLARDEATLVAAEQRLSALPREIELEAEVFAAQQRIAECDTRDSMRRNAVQLLQQLESARAEYAAALRDEAVMADNAAVLEREIASCRPKADAARDALARLDVYRGIRVREEELRSREVAIAAALSAVPQPQQPPLVGDEINYNESAGVPCRQPEAARGTAQKLSALAATTEAAVKTATQLVNTFERDGVAACPLCTTPTESLQDVVAAAKAELPQLQESLRAYESRARAWFEYEQALQRAAETSRAHESALASIRAELASLAGLAEEVSGSEDDLRGAVRTYTYLVDGLAALKNQLREVSGRVVGLREKISATESTLAELTTNARDGDADAATRAEAAGTIARAGGLLSEARELARTVSAFQARVRVLAAALETADAAFAARRSNAIKRQRVADMRDLVHFQAAPRFAVQCGLQRIQPVMNGMLDMFDAEFRVTADEGLSFMADFPDGRRQPAGRLSAGQKVVLAISFRLALNLTAAEDLGFMAMDEPTAYLDERHIAGFTPVLARMREFADSHGFQCILITHEQTLAPLFDSVVAVHTAD